MANSHVLEQIEPGKYRIVHHLPIPAANNPAGVPYRTILAAAPVVNVAAPIVNVAASEQPAPVVNVSAPRATSQTQTVNRDDKGNIVGTTTTIKYEGQ